MATRKESETKTVVRKAEFMPFAESAEVPGHQNLELILDLSLRVTVELGRTTMSVREVLSLGPGSVFQLDRLAGEQVDILINDRAIAKGEVVVVDENFGVRITDIIAPNKRLPGKD
jgi:flagellar motor switch protein FliN/FliY